MPRKIASKATRMRRVRSGYLASGRKSIKRTTKIFGGTRTEILAGHGKKKK